MRGLCRIVLSVSLLLASAITAQVKYFPPDFPPNWYAKHLSALEEPSLWETSKTQRTQSYRFLWLRSSHNPVAIRVDVNADSASRLTVKVTRGGKLIQNYALTLTRDETDRFLGQIEVQNFWELKSIEKGRGVDGAQWIIEGVRNGTYHIVDRWSPKDGAVRALGLFMVNDLAKMKLEAKDVY
jgi:hypothetical protein